jgi:PAS domain S-box-containing protein
VVALTPEERAWLAAHPVIRVAQDPFWPPVEFADDKGEPSGVSNDYLTLVEQKLGVRFERVRNLRWQELYPKLQRWEIDMTTSVSQTPSRQAFWTFTRPYIQIPIVILTRSDVPYVPNLHSLAGKKVAVVDGYASIEWIARDHPDVELVKVADVKDGLDRLQKGEVFAFVDNMLVVGWFLTKYRMSNLKVAGGTPYVNAQCMAVRKDWAILAGILQKALDAIPEAERTGIYDRWVPIRYEHGFDYRLFWWALGAFLLAALALLAWIWTLSREVQRRRRIEMALRASEERFRLAMDATSDGLWDWDLAQGRVYFSPGYFRIIGFEPGDLPDALQTWSDLLHPEDRDRALAATEACVSGQTQILSTEFRLRTKGDAWRWILSRGRATERDDSGRAVRMIGTHIDITDRKNTEAALAEAMRRKDEFLAMLGHELRNPLAPICNAAYVLKKIGSQDPRAQRAQEMIERQATHLSRLVDDLLDVSRIARGKVLLKKERVDWAQIVRSTTEDHRKEIEQRDLALEMSLPDGPVWVLGDTTRLSQVVANVLDNSAKFTDAGAIRVELRVEQNGAWSALSVTDTGLGMAPETLSRIFEPFMQADVDLARTRGGLGLGAALTKGLVESFGGTVEVASEGLGRGTRFTVRLPLAEPGTIPEVKRASPAQRKVLVIEDNQDAAESLRMLLELQGTTVDVAVDGASGLKRVREFRPDVVLCDIGLPGDMDGYAVAKAVRASPDLSRIHMIALTGYGQEEDKVRAREAGFDLHMTKPVDGGVLEGALASVVAGGSMRRAKAEA